jgi:hypothetical protein
MAIMTGENFGTKYFILKLGGIFWHLFWHVSGQRWGKENSWWKQDNLANMVSQPMERNWHW